MKFAQILYGKAHWVFEAEEKPEFAPNIILVDITGRNDIQEGWEYSSQTGEFTQQILPEPAPIDTQPSLEEMQAQTLLNTEMLLIQKELETEASL